MEEVAVGPGAAETVVFSDPEGEVSNGWARLTSDDPFNATVFFQIAGFGNVGVLPSEQGVKFKLFSFVGDGTDTGFAVANTSKTQSSTVTARIFSAAGVFQREVQKTYAPGEHEALFVTQEPLLVEADSVIEFTATQPVILLGLRSDNNLLASTAVIQPEGTGIDPGSMGTNNFYSFELCNEDNKLSDVIEVNGDVFQVKIGCKGIDWHITAVADLSAQIEIFAEHYGTTSCTFRVNASDISDIQAMKGECVVDEGGESSVKVGVKYLGALAD